MKNSYFYIKICLLICDIVCIILSVVFFYQIITRQNKLLEAEMTDTIKSLKEENTALSERVNEIIFDTQDFIVKSKELEEKINEAESWYESMEIVYKIRQYIDSVSAQIDTDYGCSEYIDRYFRVERDELRAIIDDYDMGEEIESLPIVIQEPDSILPIGEKMWLKYGDESVDSLPVGLLIQNPTADIGYGDARAGMLLSYINSGFTLAEEQYANLEWGEIYYLSYEDNSYRYYYISVDSRDYPTILYIEPKQ